MLEFREDFFEQEIRNGFYIDTTMKTVWASELELLQLVAEVCDRHGLTWYACFGTLLGAIRHEGFVPWDDDMDIVMKRKDYMKLLEVLPKELPEGYRVRSPQTDVGYEQYHTCINNGSGICITQEWLARNHGCPFTIGLDIFPLDYLPRNEEERNLQRTLVTLAGRLAQMAGVMADEKELPESDAEKTPEEYIADFKEGVHFLEETCKICFDWDLIEGEKWDKARSALWKVANELAMMYDESESDYLVSYIDYVQWEHKKFPKEWFNEVWGASFEGFMLPIPCGYDEVLRNSYGDYMVYRRKTGLHEYPYYARQLRQLRKYVKDVEERAGKAGIVSIDEIEVQAETLEIPEEWLHIITKADGSRKRIILSANDPAVYMAYGDEALDKLEKMLQQMKEASAEVALWWRPQPVMPKLLSRVSAQLAERYRSILEKYKTAGWGICDETDNTDRAVAQCDVYYGEMNAILQPFQNAGKAVVIAHMGDVDYKENNEACRIEHKAFPNFTDFVEVDGKVYFANTNYNGLVVADKESYVIQKVIPFDVEDKTAVCLHLQCVEKNEKICFLPTEKGHMHVFDLQSECVTYYEMPGTQLELSVSWRMHDAEEKIYLLPCAQECGLWTWSPTEESVKREIWWELPIGGRFLKHGSLDAERFYTLLTYTNELYITDVAEQTIDKILLPDETVARIQYDGQNFWYLIQGSPEVVCWNKDEGVVCRIEMPEAAYVATKKITASWDLYCYCNQVFLVSRDGEELYLINKEKQEFVLMCSLQLDSTNYSTKDKMPFFKVKDNNLLVMRQAVNAMMIVDLRSNNAKQYSVSWCANQEMTRRLEQILLDRGALLYEDDRFDLSALLQYCK